MIIHGGARVLDKLRQHHGDVFRRPRLGKTDMLAIMAKALLRVSV